MNGRELQRALYKASRATGDYNAARRGPDVLAKRLVRRHLHRAMWRALGPIGRWPR